MISQIYRISLLLFLLFISLQTRCQQVRITKVVVQPQSPAEKGLTQIQPVHNAVTLPFQRSAVFICFGSTAPVAGFIFHLKGITLRDVYTRNNYAFFNNLPAGEYQFTVRAISRPTWPAAYVNILVEAPIWLRWWFLPLMSLYGMILIGIFFYFLYRYRLRRLLHLHAVRESIARDLHDDIGSSLSSISILSQSVVNLSRKDPQKAQQLVHKIGETARQVMDSMGEIIWSVNPQNDSMAQIVTYMRDVGNDLLDELAVIFTLSVNEAALQTHLPLEKRRDFFLIYKEALHNIVKYAQARHVWIWIERQEANLVLTIQDDGVGFNPDQPNSLNPAGGNGLKNMRQRAEKMGSNFTISSQQGQGTILTLQIILVKWWSRHMIMGLITRTKCVSFMNDSLNAQWLFVSVYMKIIRICAMPLLLLVQTTDNFELVGAFGDCLNLEQQVSAHHPHVVLMDIDLPGISGIEATLRLRRMFPETDVLMLTVFEDDNNVFEAIRAGAVGYLLKKTPPSRILEAIQQVYEGGAPMSPVIARRIMQSLHVSTAPHELDRLTPRESMILSLLAAGKSYKMVAVEAGISIDTVRTHIKRIYEKLHVHSVTEAVAKFLTR